MAFRRFRRGFRRRRARKNETYTLIQCLDCQNVYGDMPCGGAMVQAIPLMAMNLPRNAINDATEVTSGSDRFLTVAGIKFQAEHSFDPFEIISSGACDPQATDLVFNLRIWEAIVVLPFAQGTQVPAYLPDFTSPVNQTGDLADRVLWKRISILPIWGTNATGGIPQLETTIRDVGHGPVVVKSKVRLDDKHGLYYVRNYVHDVAGLPPPNVNRCTASLEFNPCVMPVQTDAWFKTYVHAIR